MCSISDQILNFGCHQLALNTLKWFFQNLILGMLVTLQPEWMAPEVLRNELSDEKYGFFYSHIYLDIYKSLRQSGVPFMLDYKE